MKLDLELQTSLRLATIPFAIAILAYNRKWLTPIGSVSGFLLSSIIINAGFAEVMALLLFFILGTFASKYSEKLVEQRKKNQSKGEKYSVISYESETEKGRDATQVFATAAIPALLCLAILSDIDLDKSILASFYFSYFACNLADTLASEFGVLSSEKPFLITTLQRVPRGTDGAISIEGSIAALSGGLIIGLSASFSSYIHHNQAMPFLTPWRFAIIGFIGCTFDSILGAFLQKTDQMAKNPESWKLLNCLVNSLSGLLTIMVDLTFQRYEYESILISIAAASFMLLFISPISKFLARKLLHMGISLVVIVASSVFELRSFITIVALVVSFLTLPQLQLDNLWTRFAKPSTLTREAKDSGMFLYALVTGFVFFSFSAREAEKILFPMYFADSIGSIIGYYSNFQTTKPRKLAHEPIVSKTLTGSCAFFVCQLVSLHWFSSYDLLQSATLASNLALIELCTASLDNLFLPVGFICLSRMETSYLQLACFVLSALCCHYFLFNNSSKLHRQGLHAFYKFTRPHTIVGTSLSITVVMALTIFNDIRWDSLAKFYPTILGGYFITVLASLQANVFIVGLNQIYDIEIDIINKPYLPLASGEFTPAYSNALVVFCLLTSMFNAYFYGNLELLYTVILGNIMGTVYSVHIPYLHWKRFPILAASLIFMVRGGLVQFGFAEYTRRLVNDETKLEIHGVLDNKYIVFLTVFLTFFGVAIAMFKDVPDIAGDEEKGIRTFAVRFGARKVVNFVNTMLGTLYLAGAVYWFQEGSLVGGIGHLLTFALLGLKLNATIVKGKEAPTSIRASYMSIWKAFYMEYLLVGGLFAIDMAMV